MHPGKRQYDCPWVEYTGNEPKSGYGTRPCNRLNSFHHGQREWRQVYFYYKLFYNFGIFYPK